MENQFNRRTALAAITGTVGIAAVPVAALAQNAAPDRTAWDRAFAAYEKAKAEDDAFNPVFDKLCEQCMHATDALPHVAFRPDPHTGRRQPVSTAEREFVKRARRLVQDVKAGKCYLETERYPELGDHWQLCQEVAAAADERDTKIAAIRARFGMDEAEPKWEQLGERHCDAEWVVMNTPAPDAAALLWKLEKLLNVEQEGGTASWSEQAIAQTMADARRLLVNWRA